MSAAPVYPVREPGVRRELPPAPKRRRRTVRRRAPRRNFAQVVIAQVALFGFVCSVTFGFSSLTGHSLMEQQRREALRAGNRARVARSDLAHVLDKIDDSDYGKFAWVIDPEGNKVELWQPPAGQ